MRGLDTYYGRKIVRLDSDSDGNWFIELDGGVRVINTDGRRKIPTDLPNDGVGLRFATLILEASSTQLAFQDDFNSEWRVTLSPLSYQIYDADQGEAPFAPQAGGYGAAGLTVEAPPEPAERLADGPDEQPEDEEAVDEETAEEKK